MPFQNQQQAYAQSVGTVQVGNVIVQDRNPSSNDVHYKIGTLWLNPQNITLWYLNSQSSAGGILQSLWVGLESSVETLSDTLNTIVDPSSALDSPPHNIQLTNLDGSISIVADAANHRLIFSAANGGFSWQIVTTATALTDGVGYFANAVGSVAFSLPATSSVGDTYQIVAMSSGGWSISQSAGQQMRLGNVASTLGASGSISSTAQGDWIELACSVANTNWIANAVQGNLTIV